MVEHTNQDQLRAEARLWLQWARGAAGPWLPAEQPAPRSLAPPLARGASPRTGPSGRSERTVTGSPAAPRQAAVLPNEALPEEVLTPEQRQVALDALAGEVSACKRCVLSGSRQHAVPGEGSVTPRLVIVGEAPGAQEDRTGRPFVGAAGQLLTRMLAAIGLGRDQVYICNLLKCRPPENRNPRPDEIASCKPFLREQLRILRPPLLLALGSPAARELLQTRRGITSLRGRFMRTVDGFRVMPTYHPAYLLRNAAAKRDVWEDLKKVAADLGLEIPKTAD